MTTNFRNLAQALYPIKLPVRYEILARDRIHGQQGQGLTVGIGSRAVIFHTDLEIEEGRKVKLEVAWPAALPDGTSLNLWVHGKVTRSASSNVEIEVAKYEFRTRRSVQMANTQVIRQFAPKLARAAGAGM
jgi:hypothetical protein